MDTTVAPASTISAVPVQGAMAVPDISHLNSPEQNISDDLVLLQEVLRSYKKAKGQFPTGTNAAIVVLLMSKDSGAPWIPAGHRALSAEGQLVDRWGTALQFVNMPDGGMTIRTAGPDTQYGTQDDFRVVVAP
ncbi:MAG: type II secretion system protein GspG [Verrucomicrobiota bacterium]|nr:type II secretion system protein GspG [Verrucomicrobiota bacterium]